VATYKTSEFKKGLKVLIDKEPYQVVEATFRKPGKGNAIYTLRMRNLVRGTMLERNFKGGESIEGADVHETEAQYLYRQADTFVFMDTASYEQYELGQAQIGDDWKFLKESMPCSLVLWNGNPITISLPNHIEVEVTECEPGAKGDTATNVTKPAKVETGAEFLVPIFIKQGNIIKIDTRTGDYVERVSN